MTTNTNTNTNTNTLVRVRGCVYSSREAALNDGWDDAENWREGEWIALAPIGWDD